MTKMSAKTSSCRIRLRKISAIENIDIDRFINKSIVIIIDRRLVQTAARTRPSVIDGAEHMP